MLDAKNQKRKISSNMPEINEEPVVDLLNVDEVVDL